MDPYIVKRSLEHYNENIQRVVVLKARHKILTDKLHSLKSGGSTPKIPDGTSASNDTKLNNAISEIDETMESIKHLEYEILIVENFFTIVKGRDLDIISAKYARKQSFYDLSIEFNCSKSYIFNEVERIIVRNSPYLN